MFAVNQLSADYFDAFSIPFLAGSNLTQAQIDDKAKRIVVDELLAKQLFPNLSLEEVVGKSYPFTGGKDAEPEVIQGVVASTLSTAGQVNNQPMATLYRAGESNFAPTFAVKVPEGVKVDESLLSKAIMAALPTAKSVNVMSLEFLWQVQTKTQRMSLWVIVSVAALTIFLAVLGISGLTQMTTNQRKFELAIRMATGAKQSRLVRFILKDSVWMLALGLGLGFVASVFVYQELEALLDMFPAFNLWLVTGLDVGLIVIVLLSIGWPAWRVIKQDPMQALREE